LLGARRIRNASRILWSPERSPGQLCTDRPIRPGLRPTWDRCNSHGRGEALGHQVAWQIAPSRRHQVAWQIARSRRRHRSYFCRLSARGPPQYSLRKSPAPVWVPRKCPYGQCRTRTETSKEVFAGPLWLFWPPQLGADLQATVWEPKAPKHLPARLPPAGVAQEAMNGTRALPWKPSGVSMEAPTSKHIPHPTLPKTVKVCLISK